MKHTSTLWKILNHAKILVLILLSLSIKHTYSQQFERVYANSVQKSADEYLLLGAIKAGYVTNANLAADNSPATFATLNSTVVQVAFIEIGGEAVIRLRFTGADKPSINTPLTIKLGVGGNLLTALGGITVQAINGTGNSSGEGNEVGPKYFGTSLVNLLSGRNQIEFTITPTQAYDGVKIKLGDTGGLLSAGVAANLDVYHAYFLKPASNIVCESVVDSLYGSTGALAGGLNPVQSPSLAFDKNEDTFATLRTNLSALNSTFLTGVYSSLSKAGDSVKLILQSENTGLLDLSLLSAIRVQTFENNTLSQNFTLNSPLLNLKLLGGGSNKYLLTIPTTTPFNRIRLSIGDGVANVLAGLRAYEISRQAASPVITNPGLLNGSLTACEGAPVSFTISNPEADATYKWFDAPVNGSEITTGLSNNGTVFSPTGLAPGTYDFYVALYRNGCIDPASARSKVTLIITPGAQPSDITANGTSICLGETATLAAPTLANAAITSPVFTWYLDANRTTPITNGNTNGVTYTINQDGSLSIVGLTATRDYFVSVSGSDICENAPGNLKVVTVTVNITAQPTLNLSGVQNIGTGGSLTLEASSANAISYQWYKDGSPILGAVNNTFQITNAVASDEGDYTVIALGASGCSSLASAVVTINIRGFGSTKSVSGLTADGRIAAGSVLTYTITVTNTGNTDLNDITISDPIPAGTTFIDASIGGVISNGIVSWTTDVVAADSVSLSFRVKVDDDLTGISSIGNTATVTDPNDPNNPQMPTVPPISTEQSRSFTTSKSVSGLNADNRIGAGTTLTYTIRVNNTGNVDLTGITIEDPIPFGTTFSVGSADNNGVFANDTLKWTIDVPFGESDSVSFKVNVNNDLTGIPAIGNIATVTDPMDPTNPVPAIVDPIDTEQFNFDLSSSITTASGNSTVIPNEELTVSITITNTGNTQLSNVLITNPLPNNTTYLSTSNGGSYDNNNQIISFNINSIAVGQSATVTFKVAADADLVGVTSIANTATVVANGVNKNTSASILVDCPTLSVTNVTANGSTGGNICANSTNSVDIVATSTGITNPIYYLYENDVLISSSNSGVFSLTLSPSSTPYTYTVGVSGTGFCETLPAARKTITFTILPLPTPPGVTSANVSTCENTTTQLSVANPQNDYTYNWYLSATGGTIQGTGSTFTTPVIAANTSYFVEAVSATCSSATRTEVKISIISAPAAPTSVSLTNGPLCSGSNAVLSVNNPQQGIIYRWYSSLAGGTALGEGNIFTTENINDNTTFYVESVSAATSCVSNTRFPFEVTVLPVLTAPVLSLESKTINSITFKWTTVQDAANYELSTDGGVTWFTTVASTSYTFLGLKPAESVSLSVRAIGATACQSSAASNTVTETSDNPLGNDVFIPNTFTPNNDGNNDFFLIYGNTINSVNMRIYNQWGQMIFQSLDPSRGWDGTYRGQNQPTAVYIYNVEVMFKDGTTAIKKGTITLIR